MDLKGVVEILNVGDTSLYDVVANHYWEMSKNDLVTIIKELSYAEYSVLSNYEFEHVKARFVEQIEELIEDEEARNEEY